jgi:tRNA 5-methylaminomethyl-2-thiouridine biosynthesis bifunctional protein
MSKPFQPIKTAKMTWQNNQPYSDSFGDVYFSKEHGLSEKKYVFIEGNRLLERWQALDHDFVIAETGFGTGLNFLLTWALWRKHAPATAKLHFISCEQHPLTPEDLAKSLLLWPELKEEGALLLKEYPALTPGFHFLSFDEGRVNLTLMLGDALDVYRELLVCGEPRLEETLRDWQVDAWFLDGFSPAKNPSMWQEQLFITMAMLSKPGTTLATFSAASIVKKGLETAGFKMSKKSGYGRKREMLVAQFDYLPLERLKRSTPWHVPSLNKIKNKEVLIIGAGLAGCYLAFALAHRGWRVKLFDREREAGLGASGNESAILYPQFSSFYSPLNAFMLHAYVFAIRVYKKWLQKLTVGELNGILQLAYNEEEASSQQNLKSWLHHYPQLGYLVDFNQASLIAGIKLNKGGLFIPHSGWINSRLLCDFLIHDPNIELITKKEITALNYEKGEWHIDNDHAEVLVIANGFEANHFLQTNQLPLKSIRGQMTAIPVSQDSIHLKIPLCAEGHILPAHQGCHSLGATYHTGALDSACTLEDDSHNLKKLASLSTDFSWPAQVIDHWAGIRAATPDYLPLVGPVPQADLFREQFSGFISNSKRWIPTAGPYYKGLYIFAGFGSRGLTTIPLSAEWLAATLSKEPTFLTRTMMQSLSPARFLKREISRG